MAKYISFAQSPNNIHLECGAVPQSRHDNMPSRVSSVHDVSDLTDTDRVVISAAATPQDLHVSEQT